MSYKIETVVVSSPLKSSPDKIYEVFKSKVTDIATIFPASFKQIEVVEGELGTLGCVKSWSYVVGGVTQTIKLEAEEIDNVTRSITFRVIEGDLLVIYKSFKFIVDVTEGLIKDILVYEKATSLSPPPNELAPIIVGMFTHIDAHIQQNA